MQRDGGFRRRPRARLTLSALEPRLAPTVFTVTTLNDAGTGSLRDAIVQSNASPGADIIDFQAGLTGTISLLSALPTIADDVTINGPGPGLMTIRRDPTAGTFLRVL